MNSPDIGLTVTYLAENSFSGIEIDESQTNGR